MQINHRHLKAILKLSSNDETRWLLNGVNIEPVKNGNLVVATDGRRLGVLFVAGEPVKQSFVLPKWVMEFVPYRIQELSIELVSPKEGTIKTAGHNPMPTMTFEPIEGIYPKWRQVVPKTPFAPANINVFANVLEPFITCSKVISPASPSLYFRSPGDEIGPICVFTSSPDFFGIIMPIRKYGDPKTIPAWITES